MTANGCGDSTNGSGRKTTFLHVIGKNDVAGQREWARGICRGYTVDTIAEVFGFEPTMDAVLKSVARGLPAKSRRVVEETCREELIRTTNNARREP